jgi:hypothetical protein
MEKNWVILDLSRSHITNKGVYVFAELTEEQENNLPYRDDSVVEVAWWTSEGVDEEFARTDAESCGYPVKSMYTLYEDDIENLLGV